MWEYHLIIAIIIVNMMFAAGLKDDSYLNVSCGIDFTGVSSVSEGQGKLENYPWIGILIYPMSHTKLTSVVVLVTRQMVIGSASEIDKIPKNQFRTKARVVLGTNANSSVHGVRVREYTYHSEYVSTTLSALALIQLDMDHFKFELYHICGPPTHFYDIHIYALTLNQDSENPVLTIHEMQHVDEKDCKSFYRREKLDMDSLWPIYNTCARSMRGKPCVWRGGAALAAKLGDRWHLLGFGVYGPGCRAPSRFIDYGYYVPWVKRSVAKIGKPAVTRLGPGHIILRRMISSLQRFGRCDREEVVNELNSDKFTIHENDQKDEKRRVRYNITLFDGVEYSCVIFKAFHNNGGPTPTLRLQRWCPDPNSYCYRFQIIQRDFYVDIDFIAPVTFKMAVFGHRPTAYSTKLKIKSKIGKERKILIADAEFQKHLLSSGNLFWTKKQPSELLSTTTVTSTRTFEEYFLE